MSRMISNEQKPISAQTDRGIAENCLSKYSTRLRGSLKYPEAKPRDISKAEDCLDIRHILYVTLIDSEVGKTHFILDIFQISSATRVTLKHPLLRVVKYLSKTLTVKRKTRGKHIHKS